mgnify:CR=1 FL=1
MSNNLSYRVYMAEPRKDKPHKMDIPIYLTSFDTYKKAAAFCKLSKPTPANYWLCIKCFSVRSKIQITIAGPKQVIF